MLKFFFSRTTDLNTLIFGMERPYNKDIQVCSNEVTGSQMVQL